MADLLTGDERHEIYSAVNFWDDEIDEAAWERIEAVIRRRMAVAFNEGRGAFTWEPNPYADST